MIIAYRFREGPRSRISRFTEKVLGQDRKERGKTYRRKGLLDSIPHWKLSRGVLVVREEDGGRVIQELKKWDLTIHVWKVQLRRGEARLLKPHSR